MRNQVRLSHVGGWTLGIVLAAYGVLGSSANDGTECRSGDSERGKLIYRTGTSESNSELTVSVELFGDAGRTFSARRYACANCHGLEGMPSVEGGVTVPEIQAHQLAMPTHPANGTGRVRIPYEDPTLRRAITMGVDASGNSLNPLMPRFNISDQDLADLLAYLRVLGHEPEPGVSADEIAVASVINEDGGAAPQAATAIRETLQAFVEETNASGGIYGRSLRLDLFSENDWHTLCATPGKAGAYLCALGSFGPLTDVPTGLTIFGQMQPEPLTDPAQSAQIFYLYPSQLSQLRVAIDHYCEVLKHEATTFSLILPGQEDATPFERALAAQVDRYPGSRIRCENHRPEAPIAPGTVLLLAGSPEKKLDQLLSLGPRHQFAAIYTTHLLPPNALAQLDAETAKKLRLLLPIPLPEVGEPELANFRQFLARHDLAETEVSHRIASFAACSAFAECLKRCGQRVSRERIWREITSLYKLHTGLFPPISFDINRRVGAGGAQVVRYDAETGSLIALSEWSEPR